MIFKYNKYTLYIEETPAHVSSLFYVDIFMNYNELVYINIKYHFHGQKDHIIYNVEYIKPYFWQNSQTKTNTGKINYIEFKVLSFQIHYICVLKRSGRYKYIYIYLQTFLLLFFKL